MENKEEKGKERKKGENKGARRRKERKGNLVVWSVISSHAGSEFTSEFKFKTQVT